MRQLIPLGHRTLIFKTSDSFYSNELLFLKTDTLQKRIIISNHGLPQVVVYIRRCNLLSSVSVFARNRLLCATESFLKPPKSEFQMRNDDNVLRGGIPKSLWPELCITPQNDSEYSARLIRKPRGCSGNSSHITSESRRDCFLITCLSTKKNAHS